MKHLLSIESLSREQIVALLDLAVSMREVRGREVKKVPALRGRTVATLFFESSTRTRSSFELAAKALSADTLSFATGGSSVSKGETLVDTARNLEAMGADILVLRHPASGACEVVSRSVKCAVVNAGDGAHEHPTQALLDALTLREALGTLDGKTVAIVGDIRHSRVARSNLHCLTKLGARVRLCGPPTLMPPGIAALGGEVFTDLRAALDGVDAVMLLRLQHERMKEAFIPSLREYATLWGLHDGALEHLPSRAVVLHPGPVNRGVELAPSIADGERSKILRQVTNGVAVRMAVLYSVLHG